MNYKSIFRHYWRFVKEEITVNVVVLFSYGVCAIFTTVIIPLLYKEIIDVVTVVSINGARQIVELLIYLALSIIVVTIGYRVGDYFIIRFQSTAIKKLNDYALQKLDKHSYTFFSNSFTGSLIAKAKRFVDAFDTLHQQFVWNIWIDGIKLLSAITVLWYSSRILGLVFLIWVAVFVVVVKFLIKLQIPKNLKMSESESLNTARFSDVITNIFTIKTFATEKREYEEYQKVTDAEEVNRIIAWKQEAFWTPFVQGVLVNVFQLLMITISCVLWFKGVISPGTIVLVIVYATSVTEIVWGIGRNTIRISRAFTDADEMVKIIDQGLDVKDIDNPLKLEVSKGEIIFDDVTFAYENGNDVFQKLNLHIKPGERIAFVGHSGAGKSTILKLLIRFVDIKSGTIKIDEQDIAKVAQGDLRSQIAYVPQDPSLFHRTLRENIAYAKPDASQDEIIEVAKKAHADEFITGLPDGYESLVGERGVKLSGGERQRVAIARAMLKNSPIIVLDEATSALDSISEAKIQDAFKELIKGKTTIVIAHRLSTIRNMDRIIVFSNGKISEEGTHADLIAKKGTYADLWNSQVGGFIE